MVFALPLSQTEQYGAWVEVDACLTLSGVCVVCNVHPRQRLGGV